MTTHLEAAPAVAGHLDLPALRAAAEALRIEAAPDADLSVQLVDDPGIRALNAAWRHRDAPTDVLSFPQDGPDGPLLGDVVISVDTAARQAREQGHDLHRELLVLLVHGVAHLLGHDHQDRSQARAMERVESRLLARVDAAAAGLVARGMGDEP